jgi:hypothetical protein
MLEDEVEEPVTKRPRLSSGEQPRKRKVFKQVYEPMKLLDSLPVISAISDCVQISPVAGVVEASEVQYSRDFLISSGNHVKSYLTTALASIPLVCSALPLKLKIQESEKLKVTRVFSTQNFVFASYKLDSPERQTTGTYVLEIKEKGKLIPVDSDRANFIYNDETFGVFEEKRGKFTLQATPTSLRLVEIASGQIS